MTVLNWSIGLKKNSFNVLTERGVQYEFRVSAANAVDFGETAVQVIRTPDGGWSTSPSCICILD